jgi:hypothetical protein
VAPRSGIRPCSRCTHYSGSPVENGLLLAIQHNACTELEMEGFGYLGMLFVSRERFVLRNYTLASWSCMHLPKMVVDVQY